MSRLWTGILSFACGCNVYLMYNAIQAGSLTNFVVGALSLMLCGNALLQKFLERSK
jgi:hypothetical protein